MLTLPGIVERAAEPYIGIREQVTIPFDAVVGRVLPELDGWTARHGIEPAGPMFIKYNLIAMPALEVEFAVPTANTISGDERVLSGILPAGRYATLTYWGDYDNLMDATAVLIGWAREKGIVWDMEETPAGARFASRFELYITDPHEEPDRSKWETQLFIKLADR